ncbi:MAG: hypothetical protein ACYDC9_08005 [Dermatophilaceae bacterium]
MKLVTVPAGIDFPHAALAIQITRTRRPFARKRASRETVYAITDLTYHDITAAQLADAIRGHWSVESRLHWIRDVTFEDHFQVRTATAHRSWPPYATSPSASTACTEPPASQPACRRIGRHPDRVLSLVR